MERTASTGLTTAEACRRVFLSLGILYGQIKGHDKSSPLSRIQYDEQEFQRLQISTDLVRKLEDAFIKSLYRDAAAIQAQVQKDPKTAEQVERILKHIEELLKHVQREQYYDMKKGDFLRRLARHLRGETKLLGRQLKRFEKKLEREIGRKSLRERKLYSAKKS